MPLLSFAFFFFIFFTWSLHWFALKKKARFQNILLLLASYIFYAWSDWRFVLLILLNSTCDYVIAGLLCRPFKNIYRKLLLSASLAVNLGLLFFFKYCNFFASVLSGALRLFGIGLFVPDLPVFLPPAISFYTLQTMCYTLDVYKSKVTPTKEFTAFAAYIAFFPKLLSGPIERSTTALQQFQKTRDFNYNAAIDGLRQILWGLFKKLVIADNCAIFVNNAFAHPGGSAGMDLFIAALLFSFQLYADFSGYSDIAIGTSRLFGIDLMNNFAFPYFSKSIAEFWRRWHISFSTWLRDYIFLPLSYSLSRRMPRDSYLGLRVDKAISLITTPVTFIICGLWHGANYTFLVWGILHGIYLIPQIFFKKHRRAGAEPGAISALIAPTFQALSTFFLVSFSWIFFRADSMSSALTIISRILSKSLLHAPILFPRKILLFIALMLFIEWMQRNKRHALQMDRTNRLLRWSVYYSLFITIYLFGNFSSHFEFIYLQF